MNSMIQRTLTNICKFNEVTSDKLLITNGKSKWLEWKHGTFTFKSLAEVGVCLRSNEKAMIFGYENERSTRDYLIFTSLNDLENFIKEYPLIHEVIYDIPIKMFLDIEMEVKNPLRFKANRRLIITEISKIQTHFDQCNKFFDKTEWVLLESSKKSKISFHLIANQYKNGKEVYFKNVNHLVNFIKRTLSHSRIVKNIDVGFHFKKSLRFYYCSYRKEPDRRMFSLNSKEFNPNDMKLSLLQNYFATDYYEISYIGQPFLYKPIRNHISKGKFTTQKKTKGVYVREFDDDVITAANDFSTLFFDTLKDSRLKIGHFRTRTFTHLIGKVFTLYRVKKCVENATISIQLNGYNCISQNHKHTHNTGRMLNLYTTSNEINMYCKAEVPYPHRKNAIIKIGQLGNPRLVQLYNNLKDVAFDL